MKRFFWMVPVALLFVVFLTFYLFEKQPQTSRLEKNFLWGHELFEEGKWDLAAQQYEKNLILNPQTSESHLQLAILYDDYLNQKNKAIEHYEKYLEMASDDEKASLVQEWLESARKESKENIDGAVKQDLKDNEKAKIVLIKNEPEAKLQTAQQSHKIQELQNVLKQKEDEIQNLKSELQVLHSKTSEQKTDSKKQDYEDIQAKFDKQSTALAKLQNDVYQKDKDIQRLQTEVGKVRLEKMPQDKLFSELNQSKKDLANARSELLKVGKDYKDTLKRIEVLQKERDSLQNQIIKASDSTQAYEKLKSELEMKRKDLDTAFDKNKSLQKERDFLKNQLVEMSKLKNDLEQRLEDAEKKQDDYQNAVNFKYQNYLSLIEDNKRLKARIRNHSVKEVRLNAQIKSLKHSNEKLKSHLQNQRNAKFVYRSRYSSSMKKYRVKKGESLRTIATAIYGDKEKWRLIYAANRGKIENPDILTPGQILEIPQDPSKR